MVLLWYVEDPCAQSAVHIQNEDRTIGGDDGKKWYQHQDRTTDGGDFKKGQTGGDEEKWYQHEDRTTGGDDKWYQHQDWYAHWPGVGTGLGGKLIEPEFHEWQRFPY